MIESRPRAYLRSLAKRALCLYALHSYAQLYAQPSSPQVQLPSLEVLRGQLISSDERLLHLIISHAELPAHKPSGAPWDYGPGAPDAFVRVRYPKRSRTILSEAPPWDDRPELLTQDSAVIRDDYLPVWLLSLSFVDLQRVAQDGVQVELFDQDPLGRQLIDSFTISAPSRAQVGQLLSLKGSSGATLFFEWRALARARQVTDVTPLATVDRQPQGPNTKPLLAADHREAQRLYRAHVQAQLTGDHLGAQETLLQLSQRFANTRYGRKALRLLAPHAR